MRNRNFIGSTLLIACIAVLLQFSLLLEFASAEAANGFQTQPTIIGHLAPPSSALAATSAARQSWMSSVPSHKSLDGTTGGFVPQIQLVCGDHAVFLDVGTLPKPRETCVLCDRSPPSPALAVR